MISPLMFKDEDLDLPEDNAPLMRSFTWNHPQAGFLQFTVPYHNPDDVEAYLHRKLAYLPTIDSFVLHQDIMKIAKDMWDGYALWVGDPVKARLELRNDPEIARQCDFERD